jgi:hypothetical protein
MDTTVAAPTKTNSTTTHKPDLSYSTFKLALMTMYEEGKIDAEEGDFGAITRGIKLLNDMAILFPFYARQLADDPEFLR